MQVFPPLREIKSDNPSNMTLVRPLRFYFLFHDQPSNQPSSSVMRANVEPEAILSDRTMIAVVTEPPHISLLYLVKQYIYQV